MNKYIFSTVKRKKKYFLKIVFWLVIIVYMGIIFYFSNQDGFQSDKTSKDVLEGIKQYFPIPHVLEKESFTERVDYEFILRKATHFTEYFILAFMMYFAFRICGIRTKTAAMITLTFCIVYAGLDEYHQGFVKGRSPALRDIIIDVSGGTLALAILFIIRLFKYRITRKH